MQDEGASITQGAAGRHPYRGDVGQGRDRAFGGV
jgi:hypothetical protein